jgi:hypothetical protein
MKQTCRPYYRDRIFSSLTGIVHDLEAAYNGTSFVGVKLMDATVVRQLGLRRPQNDESLLSLGRILRHFETSESESSTSSENRTSSQDTTGAVVLDSIEEEAHQIPGDTQEVARPASRSSTRSSASRLLARLKGAGKGTLRKLRRSRSGPPSTPFESVKSDQSDGHVTADQQALLVNLFGDENMRPERLEADFENVFSSRNHDVDLEEPDSAIQESGDLEASLEGAELNETAVEEHVTDLIT